MFRNFPLEIFIEIFHYIKYDYQTLSSCILVNKKWHNISIPTLWRNPLYCVSSTKTLINCLAVEDKAFLVEKEIQLIDKKLLKKAPLYNYAKFATVLDCWSIGSKLRKIIVVSQDDNEIDCLMERLLKFILEHSTATRTFRGSISSDFAWNIESHRFDACFQNLYELDCVSNNDPELFNKLTNVCKNIRILTIYYNCNLNPNNGLVQLIRAQKKIKKLTIYTQYDDMVSSKDLKEAILGHSQSIMHYECRGETSLNSLISKFKNLKRLKLSDTSDSTFKCLESNSYPNLEAIYLRMRRRSFLLKLSAFIKTNGKDLKYLAIDGLPTDIKHLKELINSIGRNCPNLECLQIFYESDVDKELSKFFNDCVKLRIIRFGCIHHKLNGNGILSVLSQSSPKSLKTIIFDYGIFDDVSISQSSLEILMKNWKGSRPFTLKIYALTNDSSKRFGGRLENLLEKYQRLGLLKYQFVDFQLFSELDFFNNLNNLNLFL